MVVSTDSKSPQFYHVAGPNFAQTLQLNMKCINRDPNSGDISNPMTNFNQLDIYWQVFPVQSKGTKKMDFDIDYDPNNTVKDDTISDDQLVNGLKFYVITEKYNGQLQTISFFSNVSFFVIKKRSLPFIQDLLFLLVML